METTTENYAIHYPELSQEGQEATQKIVDKFRKQLEELTNNTLYDFTCNIGREIVSDDSWIDLRRKVIDALCGYGDREKKMAGTYDGQWWVKIRKKILEENREEIVSDILLDKEKEIQDLKSEIAHLQERLRY